VGNNAFSNGLIESLFSFYAALAMFSPAESYSAQQESFAGSVTTPSTRMTSR
jgi:hypothetical protein